MRWAIARRPSKRFVFYLRQGDTNIRSGTNNGGRSPVVDSEHCRSGRICVKACPHGIIQMVPADKRVDVLCFSQDPAGKTAKACPTGCIDCGQCVKVCPRDAIVIKDNHARITADLCDACGKCVEVCPRKIIFTTV